MKHRAIANTDLQVSEICLGTMTFGNPVEADEAVSLVHWALDHGINFIDTADIYEGYDRKLGSAGGVAETILGQALLGRREQAIVTTKVGNAVGDAQYHGDGLGETHMRHQIDASLRRLRCDYVDIYELHKPDPATPLEQSISVMADLITQGKVRHWGFSNFGGPAIRAMIAICDANRWPRPVVNQCWYSWLTRDAEREQAPACLEHSIAITPYRGLEGGLLTGKYRRGAVSPADSRATQHPAWISAVNEERLDRIEQFEREAVQQHRTPAVHAVQWLLEQPAVASVLIGVSRRQQLQELLHETVTGEPDDSNRDAGHRRGRI